MQFPKACKLHEIATHDVGPYNLRTIQLAPGPDDGSLYATATDGRILVRLVVEREAGDSIPSGEGGSLVIEPEAWKLAAQNAENGTATVDVRSDCARTARKKGGTIELPHPKAEFPPHVEEILRGDYDESLTITLDARLLLKIQEALGTEFVTLTFQRSTKGGILPTVPVRVTSPSAPRSTGIAMPVNHEG